MNKRYAKIVSTGSFIPPKVVTNHDLEKIVDTSDEWISQRTGIKKRHLVDGNMSTTYLATKAAEEALKSSGLSNDQIEMVIVATATPEKLFPSTACLVQGNLNLKSAFAFDISAACSGFIYALSIASQFIENGMCNNALVIGSEALSKITNWEDRSTCVLFGDGAGAAVLKVSDEPGFLGFELGSDGENGHYIQCSSVGVSDLDSSRNKDNPSYYKIQMDGNEVYKFAVKIMPAAVEKVLEKTGLNSDNISLFIPHQANIRIIESAAKRLKVPMSKVMVNINEYGNTSAASVPIALDEANKKGLLKSQDTIVMVGFGGGLTWGACALKW